MTEEKEMTGANGRQAMTSAANFRAMVTAALSQLPVRTPRGVVQRTQGGVRFGTPTGGHNPLDCWVYSAYSSALELVFAFYSNFSPDDLICKIVPAGHAPTDGRGATLQFNGHKSVEDDGIHYTLRHDGLVTVRNRIARADLLERVRLHASEANAALGGIEFPLVCGSTADLGTLLDRLFLYAYAVEQAKRSLRQEPALPIVHEGAPFEDLPPEEVPDAAELWEGTTRTVSVNIYERNPHGRSACIRHWGSACVVCGFDFGDRYGAAFLGFIHVHHLVPLGQVKKAYQLDPIQDLRPVCANCHAIIHRRSPPYSIEEVKGMLRGST
jgi:hypothetical protein